MRIAPSPPMSEKTVDVGGTAVPTRLALTRSDLPGSDPDITVTVAWLNDRFRIVHLELGDPAGETPITHETLQTIANGLDNLARNSAAQWVDVNFWSPSADFEAFREDLTAIHRRRKVTTGYLEDIARIYLGNPDKPTAAVAAALDISRAHASRLVRKARDAGLIEEVAR